jgi:GTP cyclohydrolase II
MVGCDALTLPRGPYAGCARGVQGVWRGFPRSRWRSSTATSRVSLRWVPRPPRPFHFFSRTAVPHAVQPHWITYRSCLHRTCFIRAPAIQPQLISYDIIPLTPRQVPVRVHDACFTSEVLGSLKCDCAEQLQQSMQYIKENGPGIVVYLQQEGRGIGLANKIAAYSLQQQGLDTVDANRALNLPDDCREYSAVANMLKVRPCPWVSFEHASRMRCCSSIVMLFNRCISPGSPSRLKTLPGIKRRT